MSVLLPQRFALPASDGRCVDRGALEQQARNVGAQRHSATRLDEERARFQQLLDDELEKINMFHTEAVLFFAGIVQLLDVQLAEISGEAQRRQQHEETLSSESDETPALQTLQVDMLRCGRALLNLENYVLTNYTDFEQALKSLDAALGYRERDIHLARVEDGTFFSKSPPEVLCSKLERIYECANELELDKQFRTTGKLVAGEQQQQKQRSSPQRDRGFFWRECRRVTSIQDGLGVGSCSKHIGASVSLTHHQHYRRQQQPQRQQTASKHLTSPRRSRRNVGRVALMALPLLLVISTAVWHQLII